MSEKVDEIINGIMAYRAWEKENHAEQNFTEEVVAQMHNGDAYLNENGNTMAEQMFGAEAAQDYTVSD